MKKEELVHILQLVHDRNWSDLYKEGCKRKGYDPYEGSEWVHSWSPVYFRCPTYEVLRETIDKTHDEYGNPVPPKDWDAIAESIDSLEVTLMLSKLNERSDDYLAASGEPEYYTFDLGTVTYYPDGSCSDITWA